MQFFALDKAKLPIHVRQAVKHQDYWCAECGTRVRVRSGHRRQSHFYHLESDRKCRLSQKGMIHLQIQNHLVELLSERECQLEVRFPAIGRIADAVWFSQKIVFEIQCSPISGDEVAARNRDYALEGFRVIWILHDHRYNRPWVTLAERALADHPHYFSNFNAWGEGMIYDQFSLISKGRRLGRRERAAVDLTQLKFCQEVVSVGCKPVFIEKRLQNWAVYFGNDLLDRCYLNRDRALLDELLAVEEACLPKAPKRSLFHYCGAILDTLFLRPYKILFRMLLESACR